MSFCIWNHSTIYLPCKNIEDALSYYSFFFILFGVGSAIEKNAPEKPLPRVVRKIQVI